MEEKKIKPAIFERSNTVDMTDFEVDTPTVLKTVGSLFKLQKVLIDPKTVKKTFFKLRDWFNTFEGDEEDGAMGYVNKKLVEAMSSHAENAKVSESNVLLIRYAFSTIKNANGEAYFSLFELLILVFCCIDRDGFH